LEEVSSHPHAAIGSAANNTSGPVSLFDMLKRYAFSFYEVVVRIE
jgi:hypothetical protein